MNGIKEKILAEIAFEIVIKALGRDHESEHRCFRLKNLLKDEILNFIGIWKEKSGVAGISGVRLVVATSLNTNIGSEYVAEEGKSITYYRNNNKSGLVYLESEDQSDAQGLQNFFTLRDINFLDHSFDQFSGAYDSVAQLIAAKSWFCFEENCPPPTKMLSRVEELLNHLHPRIEPIPVRKYIQFCYQVSKFWIDHKIAVDEIEANRIIGRCLFHLDIFPDEDWRESAIESKISRRLELNVRYSDLRSISGDLDIDVLIDTAHHKEFVDPIGVALQPKQNQVWRNKCIDYIKSPNQESLSAIPYSIFSQLFHKDMAGIQLGEKVRQEIEDFDKARLPELETLNVISGLNQKLQQDAERFISAVAEKELQSLSDLLSSKTRKQIERIAFPKPKIFNNPLIESVRQLEVFRQQCESDEITKLELKLVENYEFINSSVGLFSFLFGQTLLEVSEASHLVDYNCEFVIDKLLTTITLPPPYQDDEQKDEENDEQELSWHPVPVKWVAWNAEGRKLNESEVVLWSPPSIPHLALFWMLMVEENSPIFKGVGGCIASQEMVDRGDQWFAPFVERNSPISAIPLAPDFIFEGKNSFCDRVILCRRDLHQESKTYGLSVRLIHNYFDTWVNLLNEARSNFVPKGARILMSDVLLLSDSIAFGQSKRQMLPTQAHRLRWIGEFLHEARSLLQASLEGKASFAADNGESYLNWLESRSPREIPPFTINDDGGLLLAQSEFSWYEEFSHVGNEKGELGDDPNAISEICSKISGYLDAHPYKIDGLSILLVLPPSDQTAAKIMECLSKTFLKDRGRLIITVAVPRSRWEKIARAVEKLANGDENDLRTNLFPPRDIEFIEFNSKIPLDSLSENKIFDIGIVLNILNGGMQMQQNTEPPLNIPGHFDPLLDSTTQMITESENGATSIVMRPRNPDISLDSWGTLAVRAKRAMPVSPTQPENTDFLELRLNFAVYAALFKMMHNRCHWVITLERYISRQQIESLEAGAPDVLSILDGIGANSLGTLVVSSRSGRDLIESRLVRKLRKLIPGEQLTESNEKDLTSLASAIYDETRWTSPHLALNAMGISRVTEEILGLAVARSIADYLHPLPDSPGFAAWISLDECSYWFGGAGATRADMCRLTFTIETSGKIHLSVLVIEGKLRQTFDPHGIKQASTTRQFFIDVLGTDNCSDSQKKIDAKLWRDRIFSAIDMTADKAKISFCEILAEKYGGITSLRTQIRAKFRDGDYVMNPIHAIFSACLWESPSSEVDINDQDGVLIVKTSNRHILPLIQKKSLEKIFKHININIANAKNLKAEVKAEVKKDPLINQPSVPINNLDTAIKLKNNDDLSVTLIKDQLIRSRISMKKTDLNLMHGEILACFESHGIPVSGALEEDIPHVEGPASILFKVRPKPGVDPRKLYEKADSLKLHLKLENEQSIGFNIDSGYVTIDVPKTTSMRYFVEAEDMWNHWNRPSTSLAVPLGEDRYGQIVEIDFSSSNSPHLLIGGTTGSGKSEALNTILYGLVRHYSSAELRLLLIDPKGTELIDFERFAHVEGSEIGSDSTDAIKLLKSAVEEMQKRYNLFKQNKVRSLAEFNAKSKHGEMIPWWVIVLDEYADLTSDPPQSKKEIEQELKRLAQKARAAGIHIIIATQKPSAEVISTNLRSNLPAQIALRVKSGTESRVIMDEIGAESLNGKGDAYIKSEGKLRRIQVAKVTSPSNVQKKNENFDT